ncbi:MAG TPA: tetratricopeptide repeat protein [Pyrinomonadaceae bacterium]|nr:tetratricopeptide repeat protein [Pyrinomonadaceae bacterium]
MPSVSFNVFVSSTWLDLQPEREAVERALQRLRGEAAFNGMEYFGSRDETTRRASLDEVDRSQLYVGIFAARYGSGITEAEYRRARERRLPCFIYFKAESTITLDKCDKDPAQMARLDALKAELMRSHIVTEFNNPDDLAAKVTADLHRWIFDNYSQARADAQPSAPTISALHQLPPPPADFTGRAEELAELTANVERGVTISGLHGQGGIGKTALALKLAQQLAPRYPDAQFYLDLKGADEQRPLSPSDALSHVVRAYHPTTKLPDDQTELEVLYRSLLHNQRALLLMDNARDAAQVAPLIPPEGCVLLVTSRQHFMLPGLHVQHLDKLPPEDAHELLLRIAPRIGGHADTIAKLCGHLPLALRLAAFALVERMDLSVADYVRRLSDAHQRLKLLDKVAAALTLSYDLLTHDLQRLWRTLAVFPKTFDAPAAAAIWQLEPDAAQDALGELIKYSLLEWDDATKRYSLHDLARLYALDLLTAADELHEAESRHAAYYQTVSASANELYLKGGDSFMEGLALFDGEWENIQAGQSWAARNAEEDKRALELCNEYPNSGGWILLLRQNPHQRIAWLEPALKAAKKLNQRDFEGYHLSNLGAAYVELGETRRAIELSEQRLFIARELGDRRGEGIALGNLGPAYNDLGDPHRALEFCEQRLTILREFGDRRAEAITLCNIGIAYLGLNEMHLAVEFFEQALLIDREIGNRRGEGINLWNMSLALNKLGDRAQAIVHAEASLKILEEIGDPYAGEVRESLAEWRKQT